jgi:hypothetical protein
MIPMVKINIEYRVPHIDEEEKRTFYLEDFNLSDEKETLEILKIELKERFGMELLNTNKSEWNKNYLYEKVKISSGWKNSFNEIKLDITFEYVLEHRGVFFKLVEIEE